ncbi:tryptophan--tRNA ligase [bacterium (Candidatus Howlettbacteria) CG_4_10_14_0_8_um_filter_40_9]|nr:MAG: tryptophan--tRNA ligase [bacterium (Candidatus Howlettbacteria) CG_4_10_14_0_8_um_filter_40_9]
MKRIFSGIQPSGEMHIGNYLGAIKNWVDLQNDCENIFCIVDLHAITVPQEPKILKRRIREIAKIYIACGIDPKKSTIFVQSDRPEHSELGWILNCFTYVGELSRMIQFKDKSEKGGADSSTVGLFDYPVLMAADILLYHTNLVPVGEDQKQHVEIARDIAKRMNNKFKGLFTIPEPLMKKETARIMGLDNPQKKMSKSAASEYNYIMLRDEPEIIEKKIKKAVTDEKGIDNLAVIHSSFSGKSTADIKKEFAGRNADFKKELAGVIIEGLAPIQSKLRELDKNPAYIEKVLKDGAEKVRPLAEKTISEVKKKIGLG